MRTFSIPALQEKMDEHGWIVTGVPGLPLYTVGLMDKYSGHPELTIAGLQVLQADAILRCGLDQLDEGVRMVSGRRYGKIVLGLDLEALEVHPSNFLDWFGQAFDYYGEGLRIMQLLWPDTSGRFPGNPGYDDVRFPQPRFDSRVLGYDSAELEPGHRCAHCGKEIAGLHSC